ncbi:MAG: hypothetical protein WCI71_11970 [Bacteroidota bacterium]
MKKFLLLFLFLVSGQMFVQAQGLEITPFAGYVFPARWHAANGSFYFNGNAQYGGIISLGISRVMDFNFTYNRIDTKATPEVVGSVYAFDEVALSQNYYMVGLTKNFRVNQTVSPFASFSLGGVYFAPKSSGYYSYWFFAMGIDAGAKIYFNKFIGLRLQAQLMMPVQGGGFTLYYGGGSGSSVYLTGTLLDFGFTGGLIFRIGKTY